MLFKARSFAFINIGLTSLVLTITLLTSCLSRKQTDYFQAGKKGEESSEILSMSKLQDPIVQPYDLMNIQVSSVNPDAARFFNLVSESGVENTGVPSSYMVDSLGEIEMPVIGKIHVAGLTTRA